MRLSTPLAVLSLLLLARPAAAEIVVVESIEWLVDSCDAVVYRRGAGSKAQSTELKALTEARRRALFAGEAKHAAETLLFQRKDEEGKVALAFEIDLLNPAQQGWNKVVIAKDFTILATRKGILARVLARLASARRLPKGTERAKAANVYTPQRGFLRLEIPFDTAAFKAVWSGSSCYLVVPADPEYEQRFKRQLDDKNVWIRAGATWRLANYPGVANEALLKKLLSDPATTKIKRWSAGVERSVPVFPVRQAAYEALRLMGIEVEKPAGYDEDFPRSFLN